MKTSGGETKERTSEDEGGARTQRGKNS